MSQSTQMKIKINCYSEYKEETKNMKKNSLIFIALFIVVISFAQKKQKDTIDTQVINVVRAYSPTVSDAFKIKTNPKITDSILKKEVSYAISSAPVASTFTPAKGKPKAVKVFPSEPVYTNFITAGLGNFGTPQIEAFFKTSSTRFNEYGAFVNYHSSQGGVKDLVLDNNFLDANVDLFYRQEDRDYDWQINGGVRYQKYNWYGLSDNINYSNTVTNGLDPSLNYTDINVTGIMNYADSFFQGGKAVLYSFTDNEASSEIYALIKPKIEFPIANEFINAEARLEFLNGKFFQNYEQTGDINYTFFNIGFSPNLEILRDNLTLNLGADLVYSLGSGTNNESKGYIYPKVTASYVVIDEVMTAFAGVVGGLDQNSFKRFANENPFVSPTLNIRRTNKQYDAYGGFKGKLASNVSYNLKGGYTIERDKPLFKLNASKTDGAIEVAKGYEAANSFQTIYDDVNTIYALAEVSVDFSKTLKFGGNVGYYMYEMENEAEPWNLPNLKAAAFAKYTNDQWFAGANLFFVGERKDELSFNIPNVLINRAPELIDLGNYLDLNLNGGYKFTNRFTTFVKVNNVLSSNYQKYTNFTVQGLQVLAGLTYKFDF